MGPPARLSLSCALPLTSRPAQPPAARHPFEEFKNGASPPAAASARRAAEGRGACWELRGRPRPTGAGRRRSVAGATGERERGAPRAPAPAAGLSRPRGAVPGANGRCGGWG